MSSDNDPGVVGIVAAAGAACLAITLASGGWIHWLTVGAGVYMGLKAIEAANN